MLMLIHPARPSLDYADRASRTPARTPVRFLLSPAMRHENGVEALLLKKGSVPFSPRENEACVLPAAIGLFGQRPKRASTPVHTKRAVTPFYKKGLRAAFMPTPLSSAKRA